MKITLNNIGKKFNRDWIFKRVNLEFQSGNQYAVLGPNGSGKSTLLQVIAGNLIASEGKIQYELDGRPQMTDQRLNQPSAIGRQLSLITSDEVYSHIAICAPYLQLIEEMTLSELIGFHQKFKPFRNNISSKNVADILQLPKVSNKEIRHYSSGMKQRVKLGMALLSDVSLVILDEPLTNLDEKGRQWYYELLQQFSTNRIVLIGSNREDEYAMCPYKIDILHYKS